MEDWLDGYIIQLDQEQKPAVDPVAEALEAIQGQLTALHQQQDTICEYLEKGVYTFELFSKRNAGLAKEIQKLQETEASMLRQKESGAQLTGMPLRSSRPPSIYWIITLS